MGPIMQESPVTVVKGKTIITTIQGPALDCNNEVTSDPANFAEVTIINRGKRGRVIQRGRIKPGCDERKVVLNFQNTQRPCGVAFFDKDGQFTDAVLSETWRQVLITKNTRSGARLKL